LFFFFKPQTGSFISLERDKDEEMCHPNPSFLMGYIVHYGRYRAVESEKRAMDGMTKQSARCSRWRVERNFWISLLAFCLWVKIHEMVDGRF